MSDQRFSGIVHLQNNGILWGSRREQIFQSKDSGKTWQKVLSLPLGTGDYLKSRNQLTARLFRTKIHHLQIVEARFLVVVGFGKIFTFDLRNDGLFLGDHPLFGKRPLSFCQTPDGRLFYGEYRGNPERSPVSLWQSHDAGQSWTAAFTFENIRHIHGVFHDPFESCLWITTGDEDHESGIWKATPDFSTVEQILGGSQQSRAITLQFTADKVFFGTDTPLETNHLYCFSRVSGQLEKLAQVDGSVFHSCAAGGKMFFSTACEPSTVNRDRQASIYQVSESGECSHLVSFAKDRWSMKYFQYGQIFLTGNRDDSTDLWITPFATTDDQQSRSFTTDHERREQ